MALIRCGGGAASAEPITCTLGGANATFSLDNSENKYSTAEYTVNSGAAYADSGTTQTSGSMISGTGTLTLTGGTFSAHIGNSGGSVTFVFA